MARPPRRRVGSGRALATLLVVLTATACGAGGGEDKPNAGPPPPSISAAPTDPPVEVVGLPDDVKVVVSDPEEGVENGENLSFVSPVFALTPGGPLDQPVTVRVLLDNALPTSSAVLAAIRKSSDEPWRYLPGTLTSDQQHVEFATTQLEEVGILSIDLDGALAGFQEDIRTGLASRIDRKLDKPVCAGEEEALENGYRVIASKSNTLSWCFGLENDKRVVKVTNRRPSAIEIAHPGVAVLENPQSVKAWDHWAGALGAANSVVPPGRSVTYAADLAPKTQLQLNADTSAAAQSLSLLQAAVGAISSRLDAFGVGRAKVIEAVTALLARRQCAKTLGKGSDALIAGCFSRPKLIATFGPRGLLLAPLVKAPTFPVFLRAQALALTTKATTERQRIVVGRTAPDYTAFMGLWVGPSRSLAIYGTGLAVEKHVDEVGGRIVDVTYQLDYPDKAAGTSTAGVTVTAVHVSRPKFVNGRVPRIGATGTITSRNGVVTPPYFKGSFCDAAANKRGACGS